MYGLSVGVGIAAGFLPVPDDIDPAYYSAVSAVIPLLLIAVLGRMGRDSLGSDVGSFRAERQDIREEVVDTLRNLEDRDAELQEVEEQLADLEGQEDWNRESGAATQAQRIWNRARAERREIGELKERTEQQLRRVDDLPKDMTQLNLAIRTSLLLLTSIAAIGEAAALSQLATEGNSQIAFYLTNVSMASLFLGLVHLELMPWNVMRQQEREETGLRSRPTP